MHAGALTSNPEPLVLTSSACSFLFHTFITLTCPPCPAPPTPSTGDFALLLATARGLVSAGGAATPALAYSLLEANLVEEGQETAATTPQQQQQRGQGRQDSQQGGEEEGRRQRRLSQYTRVLLSALATSRVPLSSVPHLALKYLNVSLARACVSLCESRITFQALFKLWAQPGATHQRKTCLWSGATFGPWSGVDAFATGHLCLLHSSCSTTATWAIFPYPAPPPPALSSLCSPLVTCPCPDPARLF